MEGDSILTTSSMARKRKAKEMASHQPPSDEGNQQATKVVEQQNEDPNPRKFLKLPFFFG